MDCQYTADEVAEGMEFINSLEAHHVEPSIAQRLADGAENNIASVNKDQELVPAEYLTMQGAKPFGFTKISQGFAITETSQHKKEAALLLEYLTSNEQGVIKMGTQRGIPCNTKAREYLEKQGLISPVVEEASKIVADTCTYNIDPNFENSALYADTGTYKTVFEDLSAGGDVKELARYLVDSVNDVNAENPY